MNKLFFYIVYIEAGAVRYDDGIHTGTLTRSFRRTEKSVSHFSLPGFLSSQFLDCEVTKPTKKVKDETANKRFHSFYVFCETIQK